MFWLGCFLVVEKIKDERPCQYFHDFIYIIYCIFFRAGKGKKGGKPKKESYDLIVHIDLEAWKLTAEQEVPLSPVLDAITSLVVTHSNGLYLEEQVKVAQHGAMVLVIHRRPQ